MDPRRTMVVVEWQTRPASKEAYFEELGRALGVPTLQVPETITMRTTGQNLVLLHERQSVRLDDPTLLSYFTEWLPSLMASHPQPGNLKSVLPIEWPAAPAASAGLMRRLFSGSEPRSAKDTALDFIKKLNTDHSVAMPVVTLDELQNLTDREIKNFFDASGLTSRQQQRMNELLLQCHRVPSEIFEAIDASWNEVQTLQ
jgi:hypothetical protein